MNKQVWTSTPNLLRYKKLRKGTNLDQASTNWHSDHSTGNSHELLFLLSLFSASKNLRACDRTELKINTSESKIQDYFKEIYFTTRELWHKYAPVNILFTGGDVVFVKPIDFTEVNGFQMFNFAQEVQKFDSRVSKQKFSDDRLNISKRTNSFETYFNADVRYFSHNMNPNLWEIGDFWAENWEYDIWEFEQDMYNAMLREQNDNEIIVDPKFAYQLPVNQIDQKELLKQWNKIDLEEASVVHLHSTRNPDLALQVAKKLVFKD